MFDDIDDLPVSKITKEQYNERCDITQSHPTRTGRHDLYEKAMRLVGERYSKGSLVELVNWLLFENDKLKKKD